MSSRELLARLGQDNCRATLIDQFYWQQIAAEFPHLAEGLKPAGDQPMAFYFRANSLTLRQRANQFLVYRALAGQGDLFRKRHPGRGKLRVLTRNHLMSFFLSEGNHYGLEYELLQRFAQEEGYQLEMVVPSFHSDLIPWLLEGKGDLIAASMTTTPDRKEMIQFSAPYHITHEWVVVRRGERRLRRLKDLAGQKIWVRRSSSYYRSLKRAESLVGPIDIQLAGEDIETEQLFEQLEKGQIDALVADRNQLLAEQTFGRRIQGAFRLPGRSALAFGVRPHDQELLDKLNLYLYRIGRDGFLKIVKEKYTENKTLITKARGTARADTHGEISPFDPILKEVALAHNLDWRLVASQMYQESRFDRTRKSSAGALGLMQVLPATAREVGLKHPQQELLQPRAAIETGVRYLKKTFQRLDGIPRLEDRIYFSLAAYNAGYGHLSDARDLAERLGMDRDRWSGNVEKALLLLEQPRYFRKARYGYCRGSEPVHYVQEIRKRYVMYTQFVPDEGL